MLSTREQQFIYQKSAVLSTREQQFIYQRSAVLSARGQQCYLTRLLSGGVYYNIVRRLESILTDVFDSFMTVEIE